MAKKYDMFVMNPAQACAMGAVASPVYGCCSICEIKDTCANSQNLAEVDRKKICTSGNVEAVGFMQCESCDRVLDCEIYKNIQLDRLQEKKNFVEVEKPNIFKKFFDFIKTVRK